MSLRTLCLVATMVSAAAFTPMPQMKSLQRRSTCRQSTPVADEADVAELDELMGEPEALLADMEDLSEEALMESAGTFGPPKPYTNALALKAAEAKWQRDEKDVGSSEVQIARAHARIKYLTEHLQRNPKDYASRRGLVAIVNKRRRLLNYLFRQDPVKALSMVKDLGIRFKPPGAVLTRAEKYAVYNSKARK